MAQVDVMTWETSGPGLLRIFSSSYISININLSYFVTYDCNINLKLCIWLWTTILNIAVKFVDELFINVGFDGQARFPLKWDF